MPTAYVSIRQHTLAYVSIVTDRVKREIVNLFYKFISFVIRATIGYEVEAEVFLLPPTSPVTAVRLVLGRGEE